MAEFLAWKRSEDKYFGSHGPSCEKLHKPVPADAPPELIETSYFGFWIPEANLNGEIYHWVHPVLGVASGGAFFFKGHNAYTQNAELLMYHHFMPLPDDITDCTYSNGISVKMKKPLEEFEISFDDEQSGTSLRLNTKAIMPPAFRPIGGHFTQAMKNTGTLVLRGKEYKIDSFFTRDRSWGDPRYEKQIDIPPIGWYVGVFDEGFAFHVMAFDSPGIDSGIAKRYPGFEDGKNLLWGYIWKDGKLLGVKGCKKITQREPDQVRPATIDMELTDENGRAYNIRGVTRTSYPFSPWQAGLSFVCMTEWTCDGRVGYGDTQDTLLTDYFREHYRENRGAGNR